MRNEPSFGRNRARGSEIVHIALDDTPSERCAFFFRQVFRYSVTENGATDRARELKCATRESRFSPFSP